ncbi:transcriptional repressor [Streptomyces badius]
MVSLGEVLEVSTTAGPSATTRTRTAPTTTWCARGAARSGTSTQQSDPLGPPDSGQHYGFTVSDIKVTYRGICPTCAATA